MSKRRNDAGFCVLVDSIIRTTQMSRGKNTYLGRRMRKSVGIWSRKEKEKNHSTQDSRVVPHRGTNWAALRLTAQIERDAVLSKSYGRGYLTLTWNGLYAISVASTSPHLIQHWLAGIVFGFRRYGTSHCLLFTKLQIFQCATYPVSKRPNSRFFRPRDSYSPLRHATAMY